VRGWLSAVFVARLGQQAWGVAVGVCDP